MKSLEAYKTGPAVLAMMVIAVLITFIAVRLVNPPRVILVKPDVAAPQTALPALAAAPDTDTAELDSVYAAILQKPVFHTTRKYVEPVTVAAAAPATPPPELALTGYLSIPGRPSHAFLSNRQQARTLSVAVGDRVERWTVVGLSATLVELQQDGRRASVTRAGTKVTAEGDKVATTPLPSPSMPAIENLPLGPSTVSTAAIPAKATTAFPGSSSITTTPLESSPVSTGAAVSVGQSHSSSSSNAPGPAAASIEPPASADGSAPVPLLQAENAPQKPVPPVRIAKMLLAPMAVIGHRETAPAYVYEPPIQVEPKTPPRTYSDPNSAPPP